MSQGCKLHLFAWKQTKPQHMNEKIFKFKPDDAFTIIITQLDLNTKMKKGSIGDILTEVSVNRTIFLKAASPTSLLFAEILFSFVVLCDICSHNRF